MTSTNIVSGSARQLPKAASPRASSPVRAPLVQPSPTHRMPSPRHSPALRPRSPLSPGLDTAARFDPLRPASPRPLPPRSGASNRRANTSSLKLPSLPRFHPANFASTHSSLQPTPEAGTNSPPPPMSPRSHQRVVSDAQKHLYAYQREVLSANARASTPTQFDNPTCPRLVPLGSPGPVTPLQLENEPVDYLGGGAGAAVPNPPFRSDELVDRLLKEEAARQWRASGR